MTSDKVAGGKVVTIHYALHDEQGTLLEREDDAYVHGASTIPRGLERALEGRKVGDHVEVIVAPADGFGIRRRSAGPQPIPRSTFPDDAPLVPGVSFTAETPDGAPVKLFITRVAEREVFVDTNHPLAGKTLHYQVEVLDIRDANPDERRSGVVESAS